MNKILKLILPLILLLPGLTNAAVEEGECFGGPLTQNIIDQYTGADWYEDEPEIGEIFLYRGVFRALYHPRNGAASWANIADNRRSSRDWGNCSSPYNCGGPAPKETQLCWSEAPFTLVNTNNGETCVSTIPEAGIPVTRDQTIHVISIDRRNDPTTYCQIEIKTLATGEALDSGPPGTGSTEVYEFAGSSENADASPDGDLTSFPESRSPVATPFMPHLLLVALTALLSALGVWRVRRKKAP